MDNLAAPYLFVIHLHQNLQSGITVGSTIRDFVAENDQNEFGRLLQTWLISQRRGERFLETYKKDLNVYRRSLFELLALSTEGISIIEPLASLEQEFAKICLHDLDRHNDRLPFKLMVPMLLLQFPAVLILLLGPLLLQFLVEVN